MWHPVGHTDACLFATGFISCSGGEGGVKGEGSGGGYGVEVGYLDRTVCFVWAVSRGLTGGVVVGKDEPEVCFLGAEDDDVVEGGGVV